MSTKIESLQQKAKEIYKNKSIVILQWATGTGKTLAVFKAVAQFSNKKHLLVLSEKDAKENWYNDAKKWEYENLFNNFDIILYHSLHKLKGNKYHTVIIDEMHHLTKKRLAALNEITKVKILGLSASLNKRFYDMFNLYPNNITEQILTNKRFALYSYPFTQAVKDSVLINPIIYIVRINLTPNQRKEYNKYESQLQYFKNQRNYEAMKFVGIKRKNLLAASKISEAKELYKKLQKSKQRLIFFANRVDSIKNYQNAVYGKKSDKKNRKIIEEFNQQKRHSLIAVGKLQEVVNLSDIESAIILQLDSSIRGVIQKIGRALRSKNPKVYILIANNTNDDVLLDKHLSSLKEYFKEYKL